VAMVADVVDVAAEIEAATNKIFCKFNR